jgi:hypothetical protein
MPSNEKSAMVGDPTGDLRPALAMRVGWSAPAIERECGRWEASMTVEQASITISSDMADLRSVRQFVSEVLRHLEVPVDRSMAVLVADELTSNAIALDAGPVQVTLRVWPDRLRVQVRDDGEGDPAPRRDCYGLRIVDRVSLGWGVDQFIPGKYVWCDLPLSEDAARRPGALRSPKA